MVVCSVRSKVSIAICKANHEPILIIRVAELGFDEVVKYFHFVQVEGVVRVTLSPFSELHANTSTTILVHTLGATDTLELPSAVSLASYEAQGCSIVYIIGRLKATCGFIVINIVAKATLHLEVFGVTDKHPVFFVAISSACCNKIITTALIGEEVTASLKLNRVPQWRLISREWRNDRDRSNCKRYACHLVRTILGSSSDSYFTFLLGHYETTHYSSDFFIR